MLRFHKNATVKNLTMDNTAAGGRCIETRGLDLTINLEKVNLTAKTEGGLSQALTIADLSWPNHDRSKMSVINIKNSKIDALNSGYAVIAFVPAEINIDNSEIMGYGALYFKDGSGGSVATIKNNSTVSSVNVNSGPPNAFGIIVYEDGALL